MEDSIWLDAVRRDCGFILLFKGLLHPQEHCPCSIAPWGGLRTLIYSVHSQCSAVWGWCALPRNSAFRRIWANLGAWVPFYTFYVACGSYFCSSTVYRGIKIYQHLGKRDTLIWQRNPRASPQLPLTFSSLCFSKSIMLTQRATWDGNSQERWECHRGEQGKGRSGI